MRRQRELDDTENSLMYVAHVKHENVSSISICDERIKRSASDLLNTKDWVLPLLQRYGEKKNTEKTPQREPKTSQRTNRNRSAESKAREKNHHGRPSYAARVAGANRSKNNRLKHWIDVENAMKTNTEKYERRTERETIHAAQIHSINSLPIFTAVTGDGLWIHFFLHVDCGASDQVKKQHKKQLNEYWITEQSDQRKSQAHTLLRHRMCNKYESVKWSVINLYSLRFTNCCLTLWPTCCGRLNVQKWLKSRNFFYARMHRYSKGPYWKRARFFFSIFEWFQFYCVITKHSDL